MSNKNKANLSQPVKVNEAWCKGCRICVEYCPKNVFEIVGGVASAVRPEDCVRCGLCQLRCPDFAILLEGKEDE